MGDDGAQLETDFPYPGHLRTAMLHNVKTRSTLHCCWANKWPIKKCGASSLAGVTCQRKTMLVKPCEMRQCQAFFLPWPGHETSSHQPRRRASIIEQLWGFCQRLANIWLLVAGSFADEHTLRTSSASRFPTSAAVRSTVIPFPWTDLAYAHIADGRIS